MVIPRSEIKRKLFHHLSLIYTAMYAFLPRKFVVLFLFVILLGVGIVEFLRLRRPEINAFLLQKFGGIHRPSEVMQPSGIFWTLLGCWLTMLVFTDRRIVLPALGFLAFGDTAAALGGKKWGRHPWPKNPTKTYEGSACFAVVSMAWALLFVRWPVAILGGLVAAFVEASPLLYNDNLWVPILSGFGLSVLNLVLGRSR